MKQSPNSPSSETKFQGRYSKEVFQTLQFAYRPFRFWILAFVAMGFLGRLCLLANANVIGWWVDSLCSGPGCRALPSLLLGWSGADLLYLLITMVTLGLLLTWAFRLGFSALSAQAVSSLYDETTLRTSRFPMRFFDTTPVGRIVTRFSSDYGNVFRLFGGPLAEFLSIVFDLFWILVLTSVASPRFLPVLLIISVLNFGLYRLNQKRLRTCRRQLSASRSPSVAQFAETAQGASSIRSFNREQNFFERFHNLDLHFLDQKRKTTSAIVQFALQMNLSTALLFFTAGLIALHGIAEGHISVGSTGVAFGLIALSGNTVQMFFEWLAQFEEAMVGVERMDQYLRTPLEAGGELPTSAQFSTPHPKEPPFGHPPSPLRSLKSCEVVFKNVSFRYSEDLPWVFQNLSFSIQSGERLGVIGRTGSGKSSLIQALFRMYPLASGEIELGGHHASVGTGSGLNLLKYRQGLSFIAQDPTLFRGSLRLNLDLQNELADEPLLEALKKVGLGHLANTAALEFQIEEKGRNLSVGEKQLICLARALLQEAPVVIMDEATSSVDPQSEEILVKATNEFFRERTQIIIAHRLSTLRNCDRVLWLEKGKIKALGPTTEVLAKFEKGDLSLS